MHSISVYYGAMKSHIVRPSNGQVFLQLCDKGSCEVVPEAGTIRAINPAEKGHNKPCQIMVSTVGLFSFICAKNVPGLMVTCHCLLSQWVKFYPVVSVSPSVSVFCWRLVYCMLYSVVKCFPILKLLRCQKGQLSGLVGLKT